MLRLVDGKIKSEGWIKEFLERDKDGITGNLCSLSEDTTSGIFEDNKVNDETDGVWSSWWPGETEGNWRDAFARLAFALDDKELIDDMQVYVENILKYQGEDGYIGIFKENERFSNGARSGELWTQSRIMWCLITYYNKTKDSKVLKALERLSDLIVRQFGPLADNRSLYEIPDEDGSKTHSLMVIEPILFMYERLEKPEYLAFCEFLYEDYSKYSVNAKFPCYDLSSHMATNPNTPFVGHGPHTNEQLRIPLLLYKATGNKNYYSIFLSAFEKLKRYMSLSGSCKSDELIGAYQGHLSPEKKEGINIGQCYPIPGIGYEYCSTTELMLSMHSAMKITGDLEYADYEEWLVMNAAMAARRQDGKAILYLCSDNLYKATKEVGDRWDYSPTHIDAAVCCAPNAGKIMPAHLENMWMVDDKENLHAVFYGPSTLETKIGDTNVTIKEETMYPFENKVRFVINTTDEFKTSLYFRVPRWSYNTTIQMNGNRIDSQLVQTGKGREIRIDGCFKDEDTIDVEFVTNPKLITAVDGTVAVAYGPLLYSRDIKAVGEDYYHYDLKPFADTNYTPDKDENWDLTLLYNEEAPEEYLKVKYTDFSGYEWDKTPITIEAKMLSAWAIPMWVDLVPIGCTILRRTTFTQVNDIYK